MFLIDQIMITNKGVRACVFILFSPADQHELPPMKQKILVQGLLHD